MVLNYGGSADEGRNKTGLLRSVLTPLLHPIALPQYRVAEPSNPQDDLGKKEN